METSLIDQHWMWMFGLNLEQFASPLSVVAHCSPFFEDYKGAWIFEREGRWIVTVPASLRDEVTAKIVSVPVHQRLTEQGAKELFGERVRRIIGPAYQGAVEPDHFKPFTRQEARCLTSYDHNALEVLLAECSPADVEDSGVRLDSSSLHGCFHGGRLVSVAKETEISPYAMTPGILTHPAFRGQGYGKVAVSAAVAAIFAQEKIACYQTLVANSPSVKIAQAIGCRDYARHLAVRLRS